MLRRPFFLSVSLYLLASLGFAQVRPVPVWELERRKVTVSPACSSTPWDALRYSVFLDIRPAEQKIRGRVEITLARLGPAQNALSLDFLSLEVDSVLVEETPAPFSRSTAHLRIEIPAALGEKDTLRVHIAYHGSPGNDGFGGFFFTPRAIYTVGEGIYTYPPSMTRTWLPCLDHPSDKALFEIQIRVPATLRAASNGLLVGVTDGDTATYHWKSRYPMSTYLFAIAVSDYDTLRQDVALAPGDTVPVINFVYPDRKDMAREDYRHIPDAIRIFSRLFGRYPFEKYGTALAPCRGAMEHQTLTTISDALVDGNRRYELLFVHELAHQWWGDLVTLKDWPDLWLNEGFASYGEALFAEQFYGRDVRREVLQSFKRRYLAEEARLGAFPVYAPPPQYMWGATVYHKGAWVLHMLRFVLGDTVFFSSLRAYRERYAFGNASTRDFQAVVEEVSGRELQWFFDQWLYQAGHPVVSVDWKQDGEAVHLYTEQRQSAGTIYRLPLEVEIRGDGWSQRDTVWIDGAEDTLIIPLRSGQRVAVDSLVLDPDAWLLCEFRYSSVPPPSDLALLPAYPNPTREGALLRFIWGKTPPGPVSLRIYDARGRLVRTLIDEPYYGGGETIVWDGRSDAGTRVAAGIYLAVLRASAQFRTQKIVILPR